MKKFLFIFNFSSTITLSLIFTPLFFIILLISLLDFSSFDKIISAIISILFNSFSEILISGSPSPVDLFLKVLWAVSAAIFASSSPCSNLVVSFAKIIF